MGKTGRKRRARKKKGANHGKRPNAWSNAITLSDGPGSARAGCNWVTCHNKLA